MRYKKKLHASLMLILLCGLTAQTILAVSPSTKNSLLPFNNTNLAHNTTKQNTSSRIASLFSTLRAQHPKVTIQLGGFRTTQGNVQDIKIQDLIGDHFSVNQSYGTNALLGLGLYFDGQQTQHYDFSYGVNAFYLPRTTVKGAITQEQLFTNLAYSYALSNVPVYLDAKARIKNAFSNKYQITADFGIGPNFMYTTNVNERSLDGGVTVPDNAFAGKTNTTVSITAGMGIEFNNVFGSTPLECGYRFFYLGQSNFDKRTNQLLNTLNTGNNYANALMCSMTA